MNYLQQSATPLTKKDLPDSIVAYKKYGIKRTHVHYMLVNYFTYPINHLDTLKDYCLTRCNKNWFFSWMRDGILIYDNKEYVIVYHKCGAASLRKALEITLSFRTPQPEFNLSNYVLIKPSEEAVLTEEAVK